MSSWFDGRQRNVDSGVGLRPQRGTATDAFCSTADVLDAHFPAAGGIWCLVGQAASTLALLIGAFIHRVENVARGSRLNATQHEPRVDRHESATSAREGR